MKEGYGALGIPDKEIGRRLLEKEVARRREPVGAELVGLGEASTRGNAVGSRAPVAVGVPDRPLRV